MEVTIVVELRPWTKGGISVCREDIAAALMALPLCRRAVITDIRVVLGTLDRAMTSAVCRSVREFRPHREVYANGEGGLVHDG